MTARYRLIGESVGASPSPAMMNAAFEKLGIDARYGSISVPRARLAEEFAAMRLEGVMGVNVTIPFKSSIVPLLDLVDEVAGRVGAVNTITRRGDAYAGSNTDVDGIVGPLQSHGFRKVRSALLIGAGGAARAFCEAASRVGCSSVVVAVRDLARASPFMRDMESAFPAMRMSCVRIGDLERVDCDVVFNASPMGVAAGGLPPGIAAVLRPGMAVFDAVYRPAETELLSAAGRSGCVLIRGHEMLLGQAAASFATWTGAPAPVEAMKDALLAVLGARAP